MTLDMMWSFGVDVSQSGVEYTVFGGYEPRRYDVEPDISAACYFYAMNAVLGTNIAVRGVMPHTMQGDYKLIQLLKTFDGGAVDMSSFRPGAYACRDSALFESVYDYNGHSPHTRAGVRPN